MTGPIKHRRKPGAATLLYALGGYAAGQAAIVYIILFLAGAGLAPKEIGDGAANGVLIPFAVNAGLLLIFGLQHSIFARTSFKRWWTTIVPARLERSTYLYLTAGMTALLVLFWRPLPQTVWHVGNPYAAGAIWAAFGATWLIMIAATFHFGHFRFFGLASAWEAVREKKPQSQDGLSQKLLYALVRHPISTGWMIAPFLNPHLTLGHVAFGAGAVGYVLVATVFEENDLIGEHGEAYKQYRKEVPPFLPRIFRRGASSKSRTRSVQQS